MHIDVILKDIFGHKVGFLIYHNCGMSNWGDWGPGIDLVWECGYIVFDGTPQTNHERHVIHRIHLLRASGVRFALFHKTISKWLSKSITTRGY